jgi:hypothetical protein
VEIAEMLKPYGISRELAMQAPSVKFHGGEFIKSEKGER